VFYPKEPAIRADAVYFSYEFVKVIDHRKRNADDPQPDKADTNYGNRPANTRIK
jgi:hypothetical protein